MFAVTTLRDSGTLLSVLAHASQPGIVLTKSESDPRPDRIGLAGGPGASPHRSGVPDLLFEDVVRSRLRDIDRYLESPEQIARSPMLHRMTVFLLYRCNLDCPYCKSIVRTADDLRRLPQRQSEVSLAAFRAAIEPFRGAIDHVHFTGGEPTMCADLPAMIGAAVEAGVPHVSLTSNGLVAPARLEAMVANGLSEARISIDASDALLGRHMTGRTDAWTKSVRTLDRLVQLREQHGRPFTIANTVVAHDNLPHVGNIVRFHSYWCSLLKSATSSGCTLVG